MLKKALIVVAAAVGYVLGARAGRQRFEQIKAGAQKVRHSPVVRQAAEEAQRVAAETAPAAAAAVKKAATAVSGSSDDEGASTTIDEPTLDDLAQATGSAPQAPPLG